MPTGTHSWKKWGRRKDLCQ